MEKVTHPLLLHLNQEPTRAETKQPPSSFTLFPEQARLICENFDARLEWIRSQRIPETLLTEELLAELPRTTQEESRHQLLTALRSLYTIGRFLDFSDEQKMYPGTQQKMLRMLPEIDEAVLGMSTHLSKISTSELKKIQSLLRASPDFGERLAAYIEAPAKEDGLTMKRRIDLRAKVIELTQRMSSQAPSLMIDPLLKKVRRYQSMSEAEAEDLQQSTPEQRDRLRALHEAWMSQAEQEPAPAVPREHPPEELTPPEPPRERWGKRIMRAGGYTMGLGVICTAGGLSLISSDIQKTSDLYDAGMFVGATVGPILLLVGLIIVIGGLLVFAIERRQQ